MALLLKLWSSEDLPSQPIPSWLKLASATTDELLSAACESLGGTGSVRFVVSGFGDESWPVGVDYDLALVLQEIPAILASIRRRHEAILSFPGQGVEREIDVRPVAGGCLLLCRSGTDWKPDPDKILDDCDALIHMLVGLCEDFAATVKQTLPEIAAARAFRSWVNSIGQE